VAVVFLSIPVNDLRLNHDRLSALRDVVGVVFSIIVDLILFVTVLG